MKPFPVQRIPRQRIDVALTEVDSLLERVNARLTRLSPIAFFFGCSVLAIAVSLAFYSPKFWLLAHPIPGTFEWSRALTFLQQSAAPFDMSSVPEPAMRWRLLPALVAHVLQLGSFAVWLVPHAGLVVLLGYFGQAIARQTGDSLTGMLGTLFFATSGTVVTITNFLGISDAWFVLGLVAVVGGRSPLLLFSAGLLCPWVDERFLIALPLALMCRLALIEAGGRCLLTLVPGVAAYLAVRLTVMVSGSDDASASYVSSMLAMLPASFPYVPLGWWMGYRMGWLLILLPVAALWLGRMRKTAMLLALLGLCTLVAITLLAADTTRSTSLLLPLLIGGIVIGARTFGTASSRLILMAALAGNLAQPFAWITYNKLWIVLPLPIELLRSWKNWGSF